jgi:putative transposase
MAALRLKLEHIARNTPEQNAHIESFHKTVKKEYLWPRDFQTYQEAVEALKEAFMDCNRYRIHSSLGYLTPYEFLRNWFRMKRIIGEEDGKEREVAGVA